MDARAAALQILIKVTEHGAYLSDTLRLHFKEFEKDTDRAFISRLCTGTVKRLIEVDFRINMYAKTKVKKMHPVVRNILRMGAYQLLYMDGVPASAAVNESVKLAKANGQARAGGFINGILRSMERKEKPYPYEEKEPKTAADCAVVYSVPEWIAEDFVKRFGIERTKEILACFLEPAPLVIRVNESRASADEVRRMLADAGVEVREVPGSQTCENPEKGDPAGGGAMAHEAPREREAPPASLADGIAPAAFLLPNAGAVEQLPAFREGLFFVQDLSSMEPVRAAGLRAGDTVIDVCAAPGGKTLHAADVLARLEQERATAGQGEGAATGARTEYSAAGRTEGAVAEARTKNGAAGQADAAAPGTIIARDVSEKKLKKIRENIERAQFTNIRAEVWDARKSDEALIGKADVVLADLPCSGLGVLKRKPEIKHRLTRDDVETLVALQQEILGTVCAYVRPGGRLVFSTCTLTEEENGANVRRFLKEHGEFALRGERTILPDALRDGFFIAVLEKNGRE